jgi:hypothetical protein
LLRHRLGLGLREPGHRQPLLRLLTDRRARRHIATDARGMGASFLLSGDALGPLGGALVAQLTTMDALVSLFVSLRRSLREALPALGALLLAAVVAIHAAHPLDERLFAAFIVLVLAFIGVRAWQRTTATKAAPWREVELGALLAVAGYAAAIHVDGGLDGRFYPLVYVAVGVMTAFARPLASLGVIGVMIAFEAGVRWLAIGDVDLDKLLPHLAFATVFAMLNTLSLRMEVARLRRASKSELQAERDRIREEARSYRLLRAPLEVVEEAPPSSRALDQERLLRSGVEEIELSVLFALRLVRECLRVHTAMLLWLDETGERLRISELSSEPPTEHDAPFSIGDGVLAAVIAKKEAVLLENLGRPTRSRTTPPRARCARWRPSRSSTTASSAACSPSTASTTAPSPRASTSSPRRPRATACAPSRTSACSCSSSARRSSRASSIAPRRRSAPRSARRTSSRRASAPPRDRELRARGGHHLGRGDAHAPGLRRAQRGRRDRRSGRSALQAQHRPRLDGRHQPLSPPVQGRARPGAPGGADETLLGRVFPRCSCCRSCTTGACSAP